MSVRKTRSKGEESLIDKNELQAIAARRIDYRMELERLENMREDAGNPGSPDLSGMPKGSGSGDKTSAAVSEYMDQEAYVKELGIIVTKDYQRIIGLLRQVDDPFEKQVLQLKYIDCLEWNDVLPSIYCHRMDYIENKEKYETRMYRTHRSALKSLRVIQEERLSRILESSEVLENAGKHPATVFEGELRAGKEATIKIYRLGEKYVHETVKEEAHETQSEDDGQNM